MTEQSKTKFIDGFKREENSRSRLYSLIETWTDVHPSNALRSLVLSSILLSQSHKNTVILLII